MRIPVAPVSLLLPDLEQCDLEDLNLLDEILDDLQQQDNAVKDQAALGGAQSNKAHEGNKATKDHPKDVLEQAVTELTLANEAHEGNKATEDPPEDVLDQAASKVTLSNEEHKGNKATVDVLA